MVKILEEMSSARVEAKPKAWPQLKDGLDQLDANDADSMTSMEDELEAMLAQVKAKKAAALAQDGFPLRSMTRDPN